jgi:hypothetical protein
VAQLVGDGKASVWFVKASVWNGKASVWFGKASVWFGKPSVWFGKASFSMVFRQAAVSMGMSPHLNLNLENI